MPRTIQPYLPTLDVLRSHALRAIEDCDPISCGIMGLYLCIGVFGEGNGRGPEGLQDQMDWLAYREYPFYNSERSPD